MSAGLKASEGLHSQGLKNRSRMEAQTIRV
jgi:hypothetical protein